MKFLIYSDLHLEFRNPMQAPAESDADILILAGDIITFKPSGFLRLKEFLQNWKKPVLFVAGNHEYYTKSCMQRDARKFSEFIEKNLTDFLWLQDNSFYWDEETRIFGGTMWTDFNKGNAFDMNTAHFSMNDYKEIMYFQNRRLYPDKTIEFHNKFKEKLIPWLEANQNKKRVVISHHAPCLNPDSNYKQSKMQAAYNSLDMVEIIEKYQPDLWIYGHTHEPDDQFIGKTRIVSNPFGYYQLQPVASFNPEFIIEI